MDLDGDSDDDLDILLGDMEPMIEKPRDAYPPTRSFGYILLVTAGLAGLQGIFALIFSNGSAFLSSLGLSKPVLSLVWISGPFSGMILQPYFGMCSDQCRSTWGRRRPFIAGGALTAFVALLGLAFTERLAKELVSLWAYDSTHRNLLNIGEIQTSNEYTRPDDRMNSAAEYVAAGFAVIFFIILNISIQPLQGGLRALLADSCPRKQQSTANAVAGAVISASNIVSYTAGFTDLTRFTFLRNIGGGSQFSILCILTSIILTVAVTLTCLAVTDRNPLLNESVLWEHPSTAKDDASLSGRVRSLVTSFPRLPQEVRQVCKVQFFCWMGWFPYLFYMTTYIGDDFKRLAASAPAQSRLSEHTIHLRSTMLGSFGFLLFAIMAFVAGNLLPLAHNSARRRGTQGTSFVSGYLIRWFRSIRNLWITSQLIFSGCMTATFFVSSLQAVCVLVGLCGISWAVSIWAPFAIISTHVADDDAVEYTSKIRNPGPRSSSEFGEPEKESTTTSSDDTASTSHDNDNDDDTKCERRRGIVFGLHNVSIAGPQILSAIFCSLIFWALEGSSQDGIGWAMRAGGVAAFCAAVMARNVQID